MPEAREAGEMKRSALTAVLREEDGVYVSEWPELGCRSCGDIPGEALLNMKDVVSEYTSGASDTAMAISRTRDDCPSL